MKWPRDRIERGEDEAEAREFVRREFGNVGLIKEVTRDMWGWRWLEQFGQDLRYGARMLIKSPGFTLILAAVGVALGTLSALAMAKLIASFSDIPFNVSLIDLPIFVSIALLLAP